MLSSNKPFVCQSAMQQLGHAAKALAAEARALSSLGEFLPLLPWSEGRHSDHFQLVQNFSLNTSPPAALPNHHDERDTE